MNASKLWESSPILQSTNGGFNETELKLLTVIPIFSPFVSRAVTTATPVAKHPSARRYSAESISFDDNGQPLSIEDSVSNYQ